MSDSVINFFEKALGEDGNNGIAALSALLELSDENFSAISEYFLSNFEKTVREDGNFKKQLVNSLKNELDISLDNIDEISTRTLDGIQASDLGLSDMKRDFLLRFTTIGLNAVREALNEEYNIFIPIELCNENAKIPTYAHETDAGLDVYALEEITIAPGETVIVPTGIKMAIPAGYEIQVRDKSGIASKTKIRVANSPGTIDSGYRQEVGVILENIAPPIQDIEYSFNENGKPIIESIVHSPVYTIEKGQKIAQLVLNKIQHAVFFTVDNIQDISGDRGGGYGSTGNF